MSEPDENPSHNFNFEKLVGGAVRTARRINDDFTAQKPIWFRVSHMLACGSTMARALCCRFGVDPEEITPESSFQEVSRLCQAEFDNPAKENASVIEDVMRHFNKVSADLH